MFNYQIIVEYLGSNYVGWQYQKNGVSIQALIEKALSKVLKSKVNINGSGRTDAGVHATGQSANFYSEKKILNKFQFLNSTNFFLKETDISIIDLKKKKKNFHARHSAKKKNYKYIILNRETHSPIFKKRSWQIKKRLNLLQMKKGVKFFLGTHNFSAMRASSCTAKSPIRTITKAHIIKKKDCIIFTFQSRSFLQKQVRSMVGCLKYVGEGKWKPKKIRFVINSKKRNLCAPPAPSEGLYLEKVFY